MKTIYVIRHAEKPDGTSQGVNEQGVPDAESLIPRGWQRAGAIAAFFGSKQGLPAPDNLYAAGAGKEKVAPHVKAGSKSARPVETVTPLASKLRLAPVETYSKGDEPALVAEVVKLEGTTLLCWQHEAIPEIARLILGPTARTPAAWPGDRFDVVWCFASNGEGKGWTFSQMCQRLLAGDGVESIQG